MAYYSFNNPADLGNDSTANNLDMTINGRIPVAAAAVFRSGRGTQTARATGRFGSGSPASVALRKGSGLYPNS